MMQTFSLCSGRLPEKHKVLTNGTNEKGYTADTAKEGTSFDEGMSFDDDVQFFCKTL